MDSLDSRVASPPRALKPLVRLGGAVILGQSVNCVSCGHQGGYVPIGLPPGVIYLCGTENGCGCDCEGRYGVPPEMLARPDVDAIAEVV